MSFLRMRPRNKYPRVVMSLAKDYVLKLPRCEGRVIVVDRSESGYDCKITCDPEKLKDWVTSQIKIDLKADRQCQVSRAALLQWLSEAHKSDSFGTRLPGIFQRVIRPYLADIASEQISTKYCYRCDSEYTEIVFESFSELAVDDIQTTTVWTCPKGHLLFHG